MDTISIIIPTLNSGKTIGACLNSILSQDYPKDKIEIIVADGGSRDKTISVIKSRLSGINYRLLANPLRTGEAGKAVGVKQAKNEIIALIDSDNILPQSDWLRRMVEPFQDNSIIASEPLYYTYRKHDPYITRYCAMIGMNDPTCLFLGNYDRYSTITNKWTEMPHKEEDKGNYLKIEFPDSTHMPTIGANGFFIWKNILQEYQKGDYLFDIDILYDLINKRTNDQGADGNIKIAKVKIGIIHLFSGTAYNFVRKQSRRILDFYYYRNLGLRRYPWGKIRRRRIIKFILSTIIWYPLFVQSIRGYSRKRDLAWLYHPIACWLTCIAYAMGKIRSLINIHPQDRSNWGQR